MMEVDPHMYKLLMGASLALGAFFVFLWAVLSGMFKDSEDVKYRVYQRELNEGPAGEEENERQR